MRRSAVLLTTVLMFALICTACSDTSSNGTAYTIETRMFKPTEASDKKGIISKENFFGDFKNDTYTAHIQKKEDNEDEDAIIITIQSKIVDKERYEWTMSGYFSEVSMRINYTKAQKDIVKVDSFGNEIEKTVDYINGMGRIQFSDIDHFEWENNYEQIPDASFTRAE